MDVIYADYPMEDVKGHSIFLVGPTPRSKDVESWRPEGLRLLEECRYPGTVFVPEWSKFSAKINYLSQVEWERDGLTQCAVIAAWVPRKLDTMPAFTTNVEFGRWVTSGKLFYGRPDGSPKTEYLDWLYEEETGRKPHNSLDELLEDAVINSPASNVFDMYSEDENMRL